MKYLILALLVISPVGFAKEVYTCTVNGKTVYQGKPCAGSKELTQQVRQAQDRIKQQEANRIKQQAEWAARKEPSIGMTKKQVEQSTWGYPSRYSETQTVNGLHEFWHYSSGRMIYFKGGVVTSISN